MKIVNREDFLKLRDGILYYDYDSQNGHPYGMLKIKGRSLETDFLCMDVGIPSAPDVDLNTAYDQMENYHASYKLCDDYYGREGLFEDGAKYYVFENNDINMLIEMIE